MPTYHEHCFCLIDLSVSMQDALQSAQGDAGPLSLLEAARSGGVRDNRRIKKANTWLQTLLSAEELSILVRLALFRWASAPQYISCWSG